MTNIISTQKNFSLTPTTLKEAMEYAEIMAKSSIVPKGYQGKPSDILVAVQMGAELGLKPIQALQNIAVINNKPAVYGDALLALVQSHPSFEDIKEHYDEALKAAVCTVKRKNQSEHTVIYTVEDATKAGLWNKSGPWQQYPKRMLQMRARGFALRDKFADALGGLILAEEAHDYPVDVTPKAQSISEKLDLLLKDKTDSSSLVSRIVVNADETITTRTQEDVEFDLMQPREKLFHLIGFHNISDEVINKWCEKAEVTSLEELNDDRISACILHIESKYQ